MYAELHAISNYSFLRGASHPQELVEQAASLGYQAIAITDECSFAGVVKAHEAAKACEIKLIVGAEFHLQQGTFVILVPCRRAYAELSQLITQSRRRASKGKYALEFSELVKQLSHCFVLWCPVPLVASRDGEVELTRYIEHTEALAKALQKSFQQRLFLLIERRLLADEGLQIPVWQALSDRVNIRCVAAGDVYMHHAARKPLHDILSCIRQGISIDKAGDKLLANAEKSLKPVPAIVKRYPASWLETGIEIANRCHFNLDELRYEYPSEISPPGISAIDYLAQEVEKGAAKRFASQVPPKVKEQYVKELKLIEELQYEYFFLTIYDIVCFAKSQQILHQGRGSAANSVVCYCLGITEVDPTKINMLFERFISKERNEPPDIDVDFENERREEVIQYIYRKYGRERAALAATVITYRFKSAMADVGKALGIEPALLQRMVHGVDRRDPAQDWQQQLQQQELIPQQGAGQYLLPLVKTIIGFPRHLSQHVGGFIISAGPLSELVPIENASMPERTVIQWDKDDLEALGLLKVDVLALGMLTAIRKCFHYLSTKDRPFEMAQIEWEQDEVYQMLQQADAVGVFQVESRAQMSMLPRLRPQNYYDLVVQIAIVRPGPIQGDMVHPYLRRRHGIEPVNYPSQEVEAVLARTLGVPIFQEQVIQLAMVAAGFSGGEADQLRRAMASWKRTGELEQFERKLLEGMAHRGYTLDFAKQIYQQIRGFGEYGFPESHSASFALLAYVSAYLKYHHPAQFCCALLNSQPMGFYSPSQLVQDAARHKVQILPVCINQSVWEHTCNAQDNWVQLGFRLIKGFSQQSVEKIIAARGAQGFCSMDSLYKVGIPVHELNLLASANALTAIAGDRHQARWKVSAYQPSLPLFDMVSELQPNSHSPVEASLPTPSGVAEMQADYRTLGLTLGQHPIAILRCKLGLIASPTWQQSLFLRSTTAAQLQQCQHGQLVTVAGVVVGRQRPGTASGVTFVTLEDETGNTNLVIWSATASAQRKPYLLSKVLMVKGVVEHADNVVHVVAGKLFDMSAEMNHLDVKSRDFQ